MCKFYYLIFLFSLLLTSCFNNKQKDLDNVTNKYYFDYLNIHNSRFTRSTDSSLLLAQKYIENFANEPRGYSIKGWFCFCNGNLDSAIYYSNKAILIDSNYFFAYKFSSNICIVNKNYAKAFDYLNVSALKGDTSILNFYKKQLIEKRISNKFHLNSIKVPEKFCTDSLDNISLFDLAYCCKNINDSIYFNLAKESLMKRKFDVEFLNKLRNDSVFYSNLIKFNEDQKGGLFIPK